MKKTKIYITTDLRNQPIDVLGLLRSMYNYLYDEELTYSSLSEESFTAEEADLICLPILEDNTVASSSTDLLEKYTQKAFVLLAKGLELPSWLSSNPFVCSINLHEGFHLLPYIDLAEYIYDKTHKQALGAGAKVFLAETNHLLATNRNIIKREIERYGFQVIPIERISNLSEESRSRVNQLLDECQLSIHMMNPEETQDLENWPSIQNDLASEHSQGKSLERLVWISAQEGDGELELESSVEWLDRADVLHSSIEELKNTLKNRLQQAGPIPNSNEKSKKSVYLIYDLNEEANTKELLNELTSLDYAVLVPSSVSDPLEARKIHLDHLKNADLAILWVGSSSEVWTRMKFLDLVKAPGLGRNRGDLKKIIFSSNLNKPEFYTQFAAELVSNEKELMAILQKFKNIDA